MRPLNVEEVFTETTLVDTQQSAQKPDPVIDNFIYYGVYANDSTYFSNGLDYKIGGVRKNRQLAKPDSTD